MSLVREQDARARQVVVDFDTDFDISGRADMVENSENRQGSNDMGETSTSLADDSVNSSSLLEYVAASRLLPALRSALTFALQTLSPRLVRYRLARFLLMRNEQETIHAALLLLEWYYFSANLTVAKLPVEIPHGKQTNQSVNRGTITVSTSSFSEDMYGLKRTATLPQRQSSNGKIKRPLLASPFICALLSVLPMYLEVSLREKAKQELERYQRWQERQEEYLSQESQREQSEATIQRNRQQVERGGRNEASILSRCVTLITGLRLRDEHFWRRSVSIWEGVRVVYSLLYLVKATHHPSLGYHILGAKMVPTTVADINQRREHNTSSRSRLSQRATAVGGSTFGGVTLKFMSMLTDYGQPAVLCSLLGFQMIHWWYTTGEVAVNKEEKEKKRIPPPPPCPRQSERKGGSTPQKNVSESAILTIDEIIGRDIENAERQVQILTDTSLCALCKETRHNPCTLTVSGYCFCYPCAIEYVRSEGRCPITLLECKEEDIRRLHL